jgi:hypothetical protein
MIRVEKMGVLGYGEQPFGNSSYGGQASYGTTYYSYDAAGRMTVHAAR